MAKEKTIISWPQSGRTWLITMIGKIFADYYNEYDLATKFSSYGFGRDINNLGEYNLHTFPREHENQAWLKTSKQLDIDKTTCKDMYGKGNEIPSKNIDCIFLVRDPIDTLKSNYQRRIKIKNSSTNFRGTSSKFIRSNKGSLKSMIKWLNIWSDNFNKFNSYIVVKYENLHNNCFNQMRQVIDFIGYNNIPDDYIQKAIDFGNIKNMRKIEQKEGNKNHIMFGKDIKFVNDGKINVGVDFFDKRDVKYIEKYVKQLSPVYGYKV